MSTPVVIPEGAVAVTVAGDFDVIQGMTWPTDWWITEKTGAQWSLGFTTPAGPGDQTLYYIAAFTPPGPATGTMTLQDYLNEVRRLLHDADGDTWTDAQLTKDINTAIRWRDLWSGGTRAYQDQVATTPGIDKYYLSVLFPDLVVLDVVNIWLNWGNQRVRLNNPPFTDLTDFYRFYRNFRNIPGGWSRFGSNAVYIACAPSSTTYTTDWDLVPLSVTLVNPADVDPLIYPYTEPVPYYACRQALINERRWDLADRMMGYALTAMRDIEGSRVGELLTTTATGSGRLLGSGGNYVGR